MIGLLIAACEIGFWALLLAGLSARYILRRPRLGVVLLAMTPLVDLVLLTATFVDLRAGARATAWHSLAAVYLGVSIAFGHHMIRWADGWFAHRFAGGPRPSTPRAGAPHARHQRHMWYRHAVAFCIGGALLAGGILLVDDPGRTGMLLMRIQQWAVVLVVDFLWSFSHTLWPRRGPDPDGGDTPAPPRSEEVV